jgi:hypothetical protein
MKLATLLLLSSACSVEAIQLDQKNGQQAVNQQEVKQEVKQQTK